jgi:hypothetical protein
MQEFVYQSGFTVVYVGNNGDIPNFAYFHTLLYQLIIKNEGAKIAKSISAPY